MLAGDDVAFAAAGAAGQPARRHPRMGLAPKLVLAFIGLVSFVLVVNGSIDLWLAYREAENAAIRMQQEDAREAAQRIAHVVDDVEEQLGWTTPPGWDALALEQRRYDFIRLLREVPAISEVTEINGSGKEMLKVSRLAPDVVASGTDDAAQPRFADAKANGVWFSPIYFRNHSEPYMTIAVAHAGHDAGVTAANVDLRFIWDLIRTMRVGRTGYAFVVGSHGRLIAHPNLSLVLRETDLSRLPQVAAALASLRRNAAASGAHTATSSAGEPVLTAFAPVPGLGWIVFVELPLREALAPVYASLWRTAGLLVLGLLLAAVAGTWLARRMVVPIRDLQAGAERLGSGERSQPIEIHTGDEIETLADRFNQMAAKVQESHDTLEATVGARTEELRVREREARDARLAAEQALADLHQAQDRLVETQKLASLGQLTAGIAHEIKNPLNFVNNFAELSAELSDELGELLAAREAALPEGARAEIDGLIRMLNGNLAKIVEHGKRADSIVKNMLLHSRTGAGERRPTNLNGLIVESLNLAYHGARAERPDFNVTLRQDLDPAIGEIDLYPQEITRVLLNLFGNGFYAVRERQLGAREPGFEPTLWIVTRALGDRAEIRVRDNGTGIPEAARTKIFEPFFTTKPAGEGTGLGLSLSFDIVVKQHGGSFEVETEPGAFTEFVLTLPRAMMPAAAAGRGGQA
ncbi:MAG TPA: cache domain-containing protein [Stellaceae bacterium]|nr:cache domain-containing protein [Stellaceae bacterium]